MAGGIKIIYFPDEQARLMSESGEVGKYLLSKGREVEAESKRLLNNVMVNVRTGRLKASPKTELAKMRGDTVAIISSNVEYAPYVHEKRPFLTTALQTVVRTIR